MAQVLLVCTAYLLGSVPFGYLVVREASGRDVRSLGSGNIGATNVLRVAGKLPATVVLLLDMAKGCVPVLFARLMGYSPSVLAAVSVAAILGHVFPVYLGFRGGKGVATAVGAFLALAPLASISSIAVFLVTVAWKRYVSLGSVVAVCSFPLFVFLFGWTGWMTVPWPQIWAAGIVVAVLILAKHGSNLRRISAGTESRIGEGLEVEEP